MKGFTLIELLITVVLIGIISSMTLLAMGSGDQRDWQRQEAERLLELFRLASQEAMVRGNPIAVELFSNGYRFLIPAQQKWQPEDRDAIFKSRSLHPKLHLDLQIEQKSVALGRIERSAVSPKPHIVFTPDSEISRFQIRFSLIDSEEQFTVANTLKEGLLLTVQADARQP